MKCFSVFSGVGGFELGFPKDWEIVGFSEIDKYASQVLRFQYPNIKNYGNICDIDWKQVPDFDLLTGGSPCQDFSIAGKRRGLAGSKSSLAWEFIRGLRSKKPRYFIWENVKGVMSSRGGWDFANLLTAFSESGYALWWQVLNAKDFDVPQNRERIFVVGTRNGSPKEVFFERENENSYSKTNIISPTIGTSRSHSDFAVSVYKIMEKLEINQRYYTPIECERLMSFPDEWTRWGIDDKGNKVEISDSQRYKMCGNGVVSNVVKAIIQSQL